MSKIWKLKPKAPTGSLGRLPDDSADGLLVQLLYNRGLEQEAAAEFLAAAYQGLHDPFLFADMRAAVERLWGAIERGEKICVYGDYDADAVTANAVLQQTFRYLGAAAEYYIPDRFTEGYGVNLEALAKIKAGGCRLIVTVDCGTNSTDAAAYCRAEGLDFIITDHHEIIGDKPAVLALINPKNPDDGYPYREITGVGVAFKLACALLADEERVRARLKNLPAGADRFVAGYEKWLLDLVAIGTVADCHSLIGENRILVKYGLKVLAKTRWLGLRALLASAGVWDKAAAGFDTYTLGFIVAPRLNAAGRLEHAGIALALLLETDPARAREQAEALEQINRRRQALTQQVLSEAREQALRYAERRVLVLAGEDWPKGVVGLVAGRLTEEFAKPVIVLEKTAELCTGSARTFGEFDMIEALKAAAPHLSRFGGHKQAAGLTLETARLEPFYESVLAFAETHAAAGSGERVLELEAELLAADLGLETYGLVSRLEPFGVDNSKPRFLISGMQVEALRQVGASSQHTQLRLQKDGRHLAAIAFNSGFLQQHLQFGSRVDVACELLEDGYNGRRELKLRVIDVRPAE